MASDIRARLAVADPTSRTERFAETEESANRKVARQAASTGRLGLRAGTAIPCGRCEPRRASSELPRRGCAGGKSAVPETKTSAPARAHSQAVSRLMPIHLDVILQSEFTPPRRRLLDLGNALVDEGLSAEAGFTVMIRRTSISLRQIGPHFVDVGWQVDPESDAASEERIFHKQRRDLGAEFHVDRHAIRPCFHKQFGAGSRASRTSGGRRSIWRVGTDRLHHGGSEGDVWDELAVHDVEVKPLRAGAVGAESPRGRTGRSHWRAARARSFRGRVGEGAGRVNGREFGPKPFAGRSFLNGAGRQRSQHRFQDHPKVAGDEGMSGRRGMNLVRVGSVRRRHRLPPAGRESALPVPPGHLETSRIPFRKLPPMLGGICMPATTTAVAGFFAVFRMMAVRLVRVAPGDSPRNPSLPPSSSRSTSAGRRSSQSIRRSPRRWYPPLTHR